MQDNSDAAHSSKANSGIGTNRSAGTTQSEQHLASLCERTFLNLWSYPNVYRDQGKKSTGVGKELADLLVVCGNHVVIFSDKKIIFKNTGNTPVDWSRWCRRAILNSAAQLSGAERWLDHADRLYLDAHCTQSFPIALPNPSQRRVHLVVVALGAGEACRKFFDGGSGSLMIFPQLTSEIIANPKDPENIPFAIGDLHPDRSFVHVLDDVTLDLILTELDTITDFVNYLEKKERFIRSGHLSYAAGEEELLSYYVIHLDKDKEHNFTSPTKGGWKQRDFLTLEEGGWAEVHVNPQYVAKKKADEISYMWDDLVSTFTTHMLNGTSLAYDDNFDLKQPGAVKLDISYHERAIRYMALESRFRRRVLSAQIYEAINRASPNLRYARIIPPGPDPASTAYVFLQFPRSPEDSDYASYRKRRHITAYAYCMALKSDHLEYIRVIGIATEPPLFNKNSFVSEDLVLLECDEWTSEMQMEADRLRESLQILQPDSIKSHHFSANEYPEPPRPSRADRRRQQREQRKREKRGRK